MNWSTRLRRWVRISTPPVLVASMKPTAATVLPAPVACSNQKRRAAPGSSGRLLDHLLVLVGGRFLPVLRLLVGGELLGLDLELRLLVLVLVGVRILVGTPVGGAASGAADAPAASAALLGFPAASSPATSSPSPSSSGRSPLRRSPSVITCCWAISSARVPESASTWCGFSSAPSSSFGGSSARKRSSPSSSEKSRRHSIEGYSAPASISLSAASRARRRAVPGASASGPSPSSRKGSRANAAARSISALERTAADAATSLVLAIEGFWVRPHRTRDRPAGGK